jgi:hypothetical protein
LGGATTDEVIIRNLPLHRVDSARTWLEHLPASQIHNWDDLVRTFVGNFQGTYVFPGNSCDLCACTQKPARVALGLHTALFQALHGSPERGPV